MRHHWVPVGKDADKPTDGRAGQIVNLTLARNPKPTSKLVGCKSCRPRPGESDPIKGFLEDPPKEGPAGPLIKGAGWGPGGGQLDPGVPKNAQKGPNQAGLAFLS